MRKILSLLLAFVLCVGMIPVGIIPMAEETSKDAVIEAGKTVDFTTANNFPEFEVIFDKPIDCSGSNNLIKVTSNCTSQLHYNICYYLTIYTTNKTSTTYEKGYNKSDEVIIISLDSLGLTDEDLKSVTGYKFKPGIRGGGDVTDYTFSITVPKKLTNVTGVVTDTIKESAKIATGISVATKSYEEFFEIPLDCSGSLGVIKVTEKMDIDCEGYYFLTIYTNEKTSNKLMVHGWQSYEAGKEFTSEVTLESLGLTDDDLKLVTGYKIEATSRYNAVDTYYTFSITVPKPSKLGDPIETDIILESGSATVGGWSGQVHKLQETFETPHDLSAFDTLVLTERGDNPISAWVQVTIYANNKTGYSSKRYSWVDRVGGKVYSTYFTPEELGLTQEDLKYVTGCLIQICGRGDGTSLYTVSLKGYTPPSIIVTDTVEEGANVTTTAGGTEFKILEKTFETPLDISGCDDVITVTEKLSVAQEGCYKLTIYANGKTGYSEKRNSWTERESGKIYATDFTVEELGLIKDDLANVTGYKIEACARGEQADYTFTIKAYRPSIKSNYIASNEYLITIPLGNAYRTEERLFDKPIDLTPSAGHIIVTERISKAEGILFTLTIYTATATGYTDSRNKAWLHREQDQVYENIFPIEELGLTEDDLKRVTGYKIEVLTNGEDAIFNYEIRSPFVNKFDTEEYADLPTVYDEGDLRVLPFTSYDDIISYYPYAIVYNNGEVVNEGLMATGMTIKIMKGETEVDSAKIIVYDDLDGDGALLASDIALLKKCLLGVEAISDVQLSAIKHHGYGENISVLNLVRMKKIYAGFVEIGQVSEGEWKADKFYLSSGQIPTTEEGIRNYKELGFNMAEVQLNRKSDYKKLLGMLDEIGGIDIMIDNRNVFTPSSAGFTLSENLIRNYVGYYDKYDCVIGYNVYDEIIPDENNAQFNRALSCIELLDKYNPNSLKFINLLPSYNTLFTWGNGQFDDYVSNFIDTFNPQVLSFDYYPYSMYKNYYNSDWWRDLGLFRKESLEHNIPFWYYYQGYNIAEDRPTPTNNEIKYQMYVGLAYGAKQLSEWLVNHEALTLTGQKTALFDDAKARNLEVLAVGNYLFDKTSTAIYQTYRTYESGVNISVFYLDDLSKSSLLNSASDNLILSVFEDAVGVNYLLVVNKDTSKSVSGTIKLDNSMSISKFNKTTCTEDYVGKSNSISINIAAGGAEVYVLK